MADHLLKRRSELGLLQRQTASRLGIGHEAYITWEKRNCPPMVMHWPQIINFLGYDPQPTPTTFSGYDALTEAIGDREVTPKEIDELVAKDATVSASAQFWLNAEHWPNRDAERVFERMLFTDLPDYRRTIDRLIIDPPFAAMGWTISGTSRSFARRVTVVGASQFEFDDRGKIQRSWVFVDTAQFQP